MSGDGTTRRRTLLQSIVGVAQAIFLSEAASIAVVDAGAGDFVFEAVAGQGEEIVGSRFPSGQGLAGYVAQSGEPLIIDDLSSDPRFARDVAEGTGYVPNAMMVAPLLREDRTLGVITVLDRGQTARSTLQELELLVRFADQAAVALEAFETEHGDGAAGSAAVAALDRRLGELAPERRAAAERLIEQLVDVLA
jgi:GAF domain-containing protein